MKYLHRLIRFAHKRKYLLFLPVIIVSILYIHFIHFTSFSFTDAYNSYARAYFLDKDRLLYSHIFSHHHMMMVYFSYVIQKALNPDSLYQLVLYHRLAIGLFSVAMAALLTFRFKWVGLAFIVLFEITKYYLFGNLFLAESMVAYLLVYIAGIAWVKSHGRKIYAIDIVITALSTWLIAFLREPFIPVAGLLFAYILFDKQFIRLKIVSVITMIVLAILMISTVRWDDYFFNMFTLNFGGYIQEELGSKGIAGFGVLKIFFYPIYIFMSGENNSFRYILLLLSSVFMISTGILLLRRKYRWVIALFIVLGLANIRFRDPGSIFYGGFHMLPWYAFFIFSILLMIQYIRAIKKFTWHSYLSIVLLAGVVAIAVLPSYSTVFRDVDRQEEFNTNYGRFYVNGEIVKILANESDRLFVDNWDTLVFWQAGLDSSYTYAMYFPVMNSVEKFANARAEMFQDNPPEFYYTDCGKHPERIPLSPEVLSMYERLHYSNEPTCLLIRKDKIPEITQDQWDQVNGFGYELPTLNNF